MIKPRLFPLPAISKIAELISEDINTYNGMLLEQNYSPAALQQWVSRAVPLFLRANPDEVLGADEKNYGWSNWGWSGGDRVGMRAFITEIWRAIDAGYKLPLIVLGSGMQDDAQLVGMIEAAFAKHGIKVYDDEEKVDPESSPYYREPEEEFHNRHRFDDERFDDETDSVWSGSSDIDDEWD